MIDKIEAESPLDAEAAAVGLDVIAVSRNLDDLAVMDVEIHLAAHAAVSAGGLYLLDFPGAAPEAGLAEGDGAHGADIGAFAAEVAFRIDIVGIEGRTDLGTGAALGEVEDLVDLDFVAGPDAATTEDALVQIAGDHHIGQFVLESGVFDIEAGVFDLQPVNEVLEVAVAVLFAGETVVISGGPEKFDDEALGVPDFFRIGFDDHVGTDGHAAGSHE